MSEDFTVSELKDLRSLLESGDYVDDVLGEDAANKLHRKIDEKIAEKKW
jgi:hypothetical protein